MCHVGGGVGDLGRESRGGVVSGSYGNDRGGLRGFRWPPNKGVWCDKRRGDCSGRGGALGPTYRVCGWVWLYAGLGLALRNLDMKLKQSTMKPPTKDTLRGQTSQQRTLRKRTNLPTKDTPNVL